eukprot:1431453-Prymnesium_polylepis.1
MRPGALVFEIEPVIFPCYANLALRCELNYTAVCRTERGQAQILGRVAGALGIAGIHVGDLTSQPGAGRHGVQPGGIGVDEPPDNRSSCRGDSHLP